MSQILVRGFSHPPCGGNCILCDTQAHRHFPHPFFSNLKLKTHFTLRPKKEAPPMLPNELLVGKRQAYSYKSCRDATGNSFENWEFCCIAALGMIKQSRYNYCRDTAEGHAQMRPEEWFIQRCTRQLLQKADNFVLLTKAEMQQNSLLPLMESEQKGARPGNWLGKDATDSLES